ncbi:putative pterin-4-alpha-carbinolamine dehydratase [Aphelenchoides besseyi]|nr:putative pterin-4-alpha-carbinolamine dehydratase [Aphelenchoides besseyi]KAI6209071.1 putative pterin-4-alpha-carbinolamine dehydratase [Aphelenchoides besseyi]
MSKTKANSVDDFAASLELLKSLEPSDDGAPTHGLLVPSKKRTNSNFAYTMLLCGHTYHVCYRRDTPRGERVYWRCQLRGQCKARLITDLHGQIVQFTNPEHTHPSTVTTFESAAARQRRLEEKKRKNEKLDDAVREIYEKISDHREPKLGGLERSVTLDESIISTPPSLVDSSSIGNDGGPLGHSEGYGSFSIDEPEDDQMPKISEDEEEEESGEANLTSDSSTSSEINLEDVWNQISLLQTFHFAAAVATNEKPKKLQSQKSIGNFEETRNEKTISDLLRSGWSISLHQTNNTRQQLRKSFQFADFNAAFGFMTRCAMKCSQLRSFPEWTNARNKLHVRLPANERKAVAQRDLELAAFMDQIFNDL